MAIPFVSRKRLNPRDMGAEGKFYDARYLSDDSGEELPVPPALSADFTGTSAESA